MIKQTESMMNELAIRKRFKNISRLKHMTDKEHPFMFRKQMIEEKIEYDIGFLDNEHNKQNNFSKLRKLLKENEKKLFNRDHMKCHR